jgi:aspartate kinase
MKFGGTSVGNSEALAQTVEIISRARKDWSRMVVVTSAMSGVTNLLLSSAQGAIQGYTEKIYQSAGLLRAKHGDVADELISDLARRAQVKSEINHLITDFTNLCQAIAVLGEATPRALDAVAGLGERLSVRLLSAALEAKGIPCQLVEASQLIVTDREFQAAHPHMDATINQTRRVLEPLLEMGRIPVVTGFIGATPDGVMTTLGRGGSDYSAAILGAALSADEVWIWTDVAGVMTADPRIIPEAHTIPELTYREVAELAYFGAKVLHPKTIRPVVEAGIGLRVLNTFQPEGLFTRIVADPVTAINGMNGAVPSGSFKAVTAIRGLNLITIEGRGMLGVPGVAARAFGAVAATGTSVPLITQASSEQSICFAVPLDSTTQVISALETAFAEELKARDIDRVWAGEEVVIITVVGAGMRSMPGIAGKVFGALGKDRINVIAIAQGSSEVSISLVVAAQDAEAAVRALHQLIQ